MISKRQKLKMYRRWFWLEFKERMIDFGMVLFPVFVMTGLIAGCARFWFWMFWS